MKEMSASLFNNLQERLERGGFRAQKVDSLLVFSRNRNKLPEGVLKKFEKFIEVNSGNLNGRCVDLSYDAVCKGVANVIFAGCRIRESDVTPGGVHYVPGNIADNGTVVAVDLTSKPNLSIEEEEMIQGIGFVGEESEILQMLETGLQGSFVKQEVEL